MRSSRRRCKYASYDVERRRYSEKRPGFEPLPERSLFKCDRRSGFEDKASEMRREQEQYVQRRGAFFAWAADHVETLGAVFPITRTKTEMEVRFEHVNPAVSFSLLSTGICVSVSHAGERCDLREFDSAPRRVAGGYEDDNVMPEFVVVCPNLHALWEREVFDFFKLWYVDEFAVAESLLLYGESGWGMSAALYPGKYASDTDGCVHVPLFIKTVNTG